MTTINAGRTGSTLEKAELPGAMMTGTAAKALAVLRVSTGLVFLWAFLDKTFGLGYATTWDRAWINGGSPTNGFLKSVDVGPFRSMYHSIAGTWWANWLFMLGLLGIGLALVAGIGLRIAAGSTVLMMAMMWFAEAPFARHTAGGDLTGSNNPVIDDHFIYAVIAVVLAAAYAGHTWGLGRWWAKLPFVQRRRWLM